MALLFKDSVARPLHPPDAAPNPAMLPLDLAGLGRGRLARFIFHVKEKTFTTRVCTVVSGTISGSLSLPESSSRAFYPGFGFRRAFWTHLGALAIGSEPCEFAGFSAGQKQSRHVERRCERYRRWHQLRPPRLLPYPFHLRAAQPVRLSEQLLYGMGRFPRTGRYPLQALWPHPPTIA